MSQQKPKSCEPSQAPKCCPPQDPHSSLAPCSDPGCAPWSGGCGSASQSSQTQSPARAHARKASRKPRCLSGGTVYHIKEEEC
ncbi:late cornified envelope protein 6A [Molossus molossus]|uniref:Late cornified envelope 6A n=1 Tax=Molossus molossus TaxID=27622 RepID=A0A7J8CRE2_MOLMO|nr:late cornified envelope protein 6A [Molossus molossus]KAF6413473.1 late cornified envelope 6A [Molossus molossus]